jgi:Secretion system C-terminal sorting domain/Fibronectin type III domain
LSAEFLGTNATNTGNYAYWELWKLRDNGVREPISVTIPQGASLSIASLSNYMNSAGTYYVYVYDQGIYNPDCRSEATEVQINVEAPCALKVEDRYTSNETTTSFVANWTNVVGATEYQVNIVESTRDDYGGVVPVTVSAPTTFKQFTGLQAGTRYKFQVRAKCVNGCWGTWSGSSNITPIVVTRPTNVQASDGTYTGYIDIKWTGTPGNRFKVYRNTVNSTVGATPIGSIFSINDFASDASSNLVAGQTYYYFVVAASDIRGSDASEFSIGDSGFKKIPQPSGSVQISLNPSGTRNAGAQWRLDNTGNWNNSGSTMYEVSVGSHAVNFKPVNGWDAPASAPISVSLNQKTVETYTYTECTKSLKITSPLSGTFTVGQTMDVVWNKTGCAGSVVTIELAKKLDCSGITYGVLAAATDNDGRETVTINAQLPVGEYKVKIYETYPIGAVAKDCITGTVTIQAPPQYGSVNVTLLPVAAVSAGAKWNIDGGSAYYDSGFTLPNVTVGTHTIGFKAAPGWVAPANQSVSVVANTTVSQSYTYSNCVKSLTVTSPLSGAFTAGNTMNITWNSSGCISNLVNIELADVSCNGLTNGNGVLVLNTPNDGAQTVTINSALAAGTYKVKIYEANPVGTAAKDCIVGTVMIQIPPQYGSVNVSLLPAAAVSAGAKWNIDGGSAYYDSGFTLSNVTVGTHTIGFKTVTGWDAPASQSVTVLANTTVSQTYTYSACTAKTLTLTSPLSGSFVRGSQIDVTWNKSGCVSSLVTIEISNNCNGIAVTGLLVENTPNDGSERVTINSALLAGTYQIKIYESNTIGTPLVSCLGSISVTVPPQYGSVNVTLLPAAAVSAGAQWNIDGGTTYHNSAFTLSNVSVGAHTIGFKAVTGWVAPPSQSLTVVANTTVSQSYTYSACAKSLTITSPLSGTFTAGNQMDIAWNKSGCISSLVTIELANTACDGVGTTGVLIEGTANDGSERVTINSALGAGTYKVKIYEYNPTGTLVKDCIIGTVTIIAPPQYGSINVTLLPSEAVNSGAQWNIDGGRNYYNSGFTLSNVSVGAHIIAFKAVTGWTEPNAQSINVSANQTTNQTYTYSGCAKSLTVTSPLTGVFTAGNQLDVTWNSTGCASSLVTIELANTNCDGIGSTGVLAEGTPNDGIQRVTINSQLASGTYKVKIYEYNPVGTLVKNCITGTIIVQAAPQYGSVNVTLLPAAAVSAGAQWNIDGGTYYNSGLTLSNVSVGTHTIGFKALTAWNAPASQSVTVVANSTVSPSYTYSACTNKSLTLTSPLSGTFSQGQQIDVTWSSSGCISSLVTIELTTSTINCDASGVVAVLIQNTPNDGTQRVTIPTAITSGAYKIKLYEANPVGTPAVSCLANNLTISNVSTPQNVQATDGTLTDRVKITWTGTAGNYFKVYRNTVDNNTSGTAISGWQSTPLSFDDINATAGTTYFYYVIAASTIVGSNASTPSATNSGYFGTSCGTPTFSHSNITNNSAVINWTAVAGATSYKITYLPSGGTGQTVNGLTGLSHTLTGLTANTLHGYTVQAVCGSVTSPYITGSGLTFTTTNVPQPYQLEISQAVDLGATNNILYVGTNYTLRTKITNKGGTKYVGRLAIAVRTSGAYYTLNETTWNIDPGVTLDLVMNYTPTASASGTALKAGILYLNSAGIWDYVPQGGYLNPVDGVTVQQRVDVVPQFAIQSNTLSLPTPWQQRDVVNIQYILRNSNPNPWTGCLNLYAVNSATSQRYSLATTNVNSLTTGQTAELNKSQFAVSTLPVGSYYFLIIGQTNCAGTEYTLVQSGLFNVGNTTGRYSIFVRVSNNSNPDVSTGSTCLKGASEYAHLDITNIYDRCKFKVEWYDANSILQQTNETDWIAAGGAGSRFRQTFSKVMNSVGVWKIRVYVQNDFTGYREWGVYNRTVYTPAQTPTNVSATQGTFNDKVKITWVGGEGHWFRVRRSPTTIYNDGVDVVWDYRPTINQYDDISAVAGVRYYYFVEGSNIIDFDTRSTAALGYRGTGFVGDVGGEVSMLKIGNNVSLFPNPVTNELTIEMSRSEEGDIELSVSDILGKEVSHFNKVAIKGVNHYQINTVNFNNGLYLLHIKSKEGRTSHKFMVQH